MKSKSYIRLAGALALLISIPAPSGAGEVVPGAEARECREELVSTEEYSLDADESRRQGEGFRAESSVTVCRICTFPVEVSAGSSFKAVDVDLFLRSTKGRVGFSGNLVPFISRVEELCRQRREEPAETRSEP